MEWDESKHKRGQPDNAGQFASSSGAARSKGDKEKTKEAIRKYSDDHERDIAEYGGLDSHTAKSAIRSEVMHKQSKRGYNKKNDYAYTANEFVVFENHEIGDFEVLIDLPIDRNEDIIDQLWRWLDKNG